VNILKDFISKNLSLFRQNDSKDKSLLGKKYTKLKCLVYRMTTAKASPRPTCEQILMEKNSWALSLFELKEDLNRLMEKKISIEQNFHLFFIQTKIKYVNFDSRNNSSKAKSLSFIKNLFNKI
jgi:hypothetical protein